MIRSLRRVEPDCRISVLCLTPACHELMKTFGGDVELNGLADFERANPELLAIKSGRSVLEYYFTLSACIVSAAAKNAAPQDIVTYLDADLIFYANPAPIFDELQGRSVGLIAHRYKWWNRRLEKFGRFNVGWVSFRCDRDGLLVLEWWRARCIEWCYMRIEPDRYADQKYLDYIFSNFEGVIEIRHPGANVAPWNIDRHTFVAGPDQTLSIRGGFPLLFFHFSGLKEIGAGVFLAGHFSYLAPLSDLVLTRLYRPYVALLRSIRAEVGGLPVDESVTPVRELTSDRFSLRQRLFRFRSWLLRKAAEGLGHRI